MNKEMKMVTVHVTMPAMNAKALAQFLSRANYTNFRANADNEGQAFNMLYGAAAINSALEDVGIEAY